MVQDTVGVLKILVSVVVRIALVVPATITAFIVWDKSVLKGLLEWSWK
jgi:hypothetical protein